jgi:hypothetical protein
MACLPGRSEGEGSMTALYFGKPGGEFATAVSHSFSFSFVCVCGGGGGVISYIR